MQNTKTDKKKNQINRREMLKKVGGAALAGMMLPMMGNAASNNPQTTSKPNIVFILSDDHRWDAMSCMGHPFIKTPNMDRIAREGVHFENAFVTTSLCSPSRASFLTGQYANSHGVKNNLTPWDESSVTFMELLKEQGYDTAFIGKWHMPGKALPNLRGVDHFVTITHEGGQGVYFDCPLVVDGVKQERKGKYITEDLTDFALDYIDREHDNPFCLYLSHKAVHFGFLPPKELNDLYSDVDLKLPKEADYWIPYTNHHAFFGGLVPMNISYRNYCEAVVAMDQQMGRVLDKLEEKNILDDTVFVYISDNGHFFGEHGLYDKRLAYEESIRIPFMVRYPKGIKNPGRKESNMVLNVDIAPTLLDLAGVSKPDYMQGESLAPMLQDGNTKGRDSWLYEYFPDYPMPTPGIESVRTQNYKYIQYQKDKRPKELFDLRNDPREKQNIINTEAGKKLAAELKTELARLKKETRS